MPKISAKNQVTLPVETLQRAGLRAGDEVAIDAEGGDRVVIHRIECNPRRALGVFDGFYPPAYLGDLRAREGA